MWLGVFGNARNGAPGDLWGLDSEGDLILVELKKYPRGDDPFERFCTLDKERITAKAIRKQWRSKLDQELRYVPNARALIGAGEKGTPASAPGLLPHADRRKAWHAWPLLYDEVLTQVASAEYASTVGSPDPPASCDEALKGWPKDSVGIGFTDGLLSAERTAHGW